MHLVVNNRECEGSIESGTQVTTITESFTKPLGVPIHNLGDILLVEGTGGIDIQYKGYVEGQVSFPEVRAYNQPVLIPVINNCKFGDRVPVKVGTLIIDKNLRKMTARQIIKLDDKWRRPHLAAPMVRQVQIELKPDEVPVGLAKITGDVRPPKKVTVTPLETIQIEETNKIKCHFKRVMAEVPAKRYLNIS